MYMAYSIDARKMAMKYLANGHTLAEAHRELGIGMTTLKDWKKSLRENGTLEKAPLERSARKFRDDEVRKFVKENPFATLQEIADQFGGTATGAFHALKRLKITLKKGLQVT
jgi:transposase